MAATAAELFRRAERHLVGGVNSPVRAFTAVGGTPPCIVRGDGPRLYDSEGREYLDYVCCWGAALLGHAHPAVLSALREQLQNGLGFGAPSPGEIELAELLCEAVPTMEQLRLVSSGTEATMSAIRLARGATGRPMLLKFAGGYHGHADALLVEAGSGALGQPASAGVTVDVAKHSLVADYNDIDTAAALFQRHSEQLACVIVEPVAGNMGCIPPRQGFLEGLRELCDNSGALLIFDEVMTGFRLGWGDAGQRFGVRADLVTLGKAIGGGLPIGAFGGRRELMAELAPLGPVYQAGTLSGNPLSVCAGLATLAEARREGFYEALQARAEQLADGLRARAQDAGVALMVTQIGGMFGLFFGASKPVWNLRDMQAGDSDAFRCFFHAMLRDGIYLAPGTAEAGFISAAHGTAEIDATLAAAERAFAVVAAQREAAA